ncbi:General transcription factor II-I repeat domain-containing protein 2 [Eumeta japonica]|uniref:General transcription factor II-I repeat domain-containing protein 2 n=1 Tax=Eumeta variegata TaxID=151549 RepID=A0A4C1X3X3_EUMVA|nr:General transcription factor II-I repeat domain-containing protein 2 [Eumeta japonica]
MAACARARRSRTPRVNKRTRLVCPSARVRDSRRVWTKFIQRGHSLTSPGSTERPAAAGDRTQMMANDIKTTLTDRMAGFESFSIALDESTDLSDIAQLAIFIRGVNKEFTVTEELLALQLSKGITTGQDIFNEVQKILSTSPPHTWPISVDCCPQVRVKGTPSLALVDVSADGRVTVNKLARTEDALGHGASGGLYWPLKRS